MGDYGNNDKMGKKCLHAKQNPDSGKTITIRRMYGTQSWKTDSTVFWRDVCRVSFKGILLWHRYDEWWSPIQIMDIHIFFSFPGIQLKPEINWRAALEQGMQVPTGPFPFFLFVFFEGVGHVMRGAGSLLPVDQGELLQDSTSVHLAPLPD